MTRHVLRLVLLVALLLPAAHLQAQRVRTFTDPQQTIQVRRGTTFEIVLDSNPTTGYEWQLVKSRGPRRVALVRSWYEANKAPAGIAGSGGKERWRFRAVAAGRTQVSMIYVRSWEKKEPADSARFRVVVTR